MACARAVLNNRRSSNDTAVIAKTKKKLAINVSLDLPAEALADLRTSMLRMATPAGWTVREVNG